MTGIPPPPPPQSSLYGNASSLPEDLPTTLPYRLTTNLVTSRGVSASSSEDDDHEGGSQADSGDVGEEDTDWETVSSNIFDGFNESESDDASVTVAEWGYPEEMVLDPMQVKEDMMCPICMDIMCNPVTLGRCRHLFCKWCVDGLPETESRVGGTTRSFRQCPLCRIKTGYDEQRSAPGPVPIAISALQGVCPHCSFTGCLAEVRNHGNSCLKERTDKKRQAVMVGVASKALL